MNLQALARLGLFGSKSGKAKPSWWKCVAGDALYLTLGIDTGLPSVIDQAQYYANVLWSAAFGEADELPHDFPVKLFNKLNEIILWRGGMFDPATEQPNFWIQRGKCYSDPLAWTVEVEYSKLADPAKLATFEASLENGLTSIGLNCNVAFISRPLGIRIDKPNPPMVTLADYWTNVAALPTNELWCAPAVTANGVGLELYKLKLTGDASTGRISGKPGAGKTQLATALLLSLAYANSPEKLSMIIIDPKVIDMMVLADLPHLAAPVATREDECMTVLRALEAEMESREERLRQGDRSWLGNSIFLYIDEMADLETTMQGQDRADVIRIVQRLTQRGRAYGFIVIGATQRIYDVDAAMYTKMNLKFALAANDASDGYAATGVKGAQVHKLPGKGACELYPGGKRLQGFFVADAEHKDYAKHIGSFVTDIRRRWDGQGPHWKVGEDGPQPSTDFPPELQNQKFASALADAYDAAPDKFSGRTVRSVHKQVFGKEVNSQKASRLREAFMADYTGGTNGTPHPVFAGAQV